MFRTFFTLDTLKHGLPVLVEGSLWFCAGLCVIHCFRVFRRTNCCPDPPRWWPHFLPPVFFRYPKVAEDQYDKCREMIQRENDLTNHRLTWLLTAEGLLFASLGFALSKDNLEGAKLLIPVLSFVGVSLAASASIVLDAADAAICRLSAAAPVRENTKADVLGYRGLPMIGILAPWRAFPPMFIVAWYLISQITPT